MRRPVLARNDARSALWLRGFVSLAFVLALPVACGDSTSSGREVVNDGPDWPSCGEEKCGADEFCDYRWHWCSVISGQGGGGGVPRKCEDRSASCDTELPVCGCDGNVYASQCDAQQAGVDIGAWADAADGPRCQSTPAGRFPCGPWFCDPNVAYCDYQIGDVGDRHVSCQPLPSSCGGQASCACLESLPGYWKCTGGEAGVTLFRVLT